MLKVFQIKYRDVIFYAMTFIVFVSLHSNLLFLVWFARRQRGVINVDPQCTSEI